MSFNPSCKVTVSISGVKEADGSVYARPLTFYFYTPLEPLWGNPDNIKLDLRALLGQIPDEVLYQYMYQASLDLWRALGRTGSKLSQPDTSKTLDDLLTEGTDPDLVGYMECYVRYRTEYLILVSQYPFLAIEGGGGEKALGDFRVTTKANPADLKKALDDNITPNMNACFYALVGSLRNKGMPRVTYRSTTATALAARRTFQDNLPPGLVRPNPFI